MLRLCSSEVFVGDAGSGSDVARTARAARTTRTAKLLRVVRLTKLLRIVRLGRVVKRLERWNPLSSPARARVCLWWCVLGTACSQLSSERLETCFCRCFHTIDCGLNQSALMRVPGVVGLCGCLCGRVQAKTGIKWLVMLVMLVHWLACTWQCTAVFYDNQRPAGARDWNTAFCKNCFVFHDNQRHAGARNQNKAAPL